MTRDLTRTRIFAIVLTAFALTVVYAGEALAESVWYVDDDDAADFKTIQAALDAASAGDTIIVRDGVYTGDGNRDIDFAGKAVHLRSENGPESCIIDVQGTEAEPHRGFHFRSGEGEDSVVDGFTIMNGHVDYGGGIYCGNSSATITNNIIIANTADAGGGISCRDNSSPAIMNNTITDNTADSRGGGILCANSSLIVGSSTLWGNRAPQGPELYVRSPSSLTVRYSNVAGGAAAAYVEEGSTLALDATNIDADPLFAQPANGAGIDHGLGGVTSAEIADFMDGALGPAMARLVEGVPADHIFFIDSENGNDLNDGHSPDEAVKTFEEVFHHGVYDERVAAIPEQETVVVFVLGEKLSNISGGTIRRPNVKFVGVDYPKLYVEVIDGECQGACTLTPYRENIEICGFRIEHLCGNGIDVMADNCWVHHNRFQGAILAGGDVTIGAYDDIVSGCVVEHNVFSGEPANPHSIRILRRARRAVVRHNKFYGSETFVWFKGGTDCSSQENEFFDHDTSKGRKPVSFQSEAVRCFSLNDHLEGEPLGPSDYYIDENATDCFVLSKPDGGGDYHLKSQYGRWDPAAQAGEGGWVFDNVTSPCIDAGDPASDYDNEPMPNFGRVNIGAYGNTDRASRSGPRWNIPGDVNGDCVVNVLDMLFVRNTFLHDKTTGDNWKADVNSDGQIDVLDMILVRDNLNEQCE